MSHEDHNTKRLVSFSRLSAIVNTSSTCNQSPRIRDEIPAASKKTVCSGCGKTVVGFRSRRIHRVGDLDAGEAHLYLDFEYRRVVYPDCKAVKQEILAWPASSKRFAQRFETRIGGMCRHMPLTEGAKLNGLSWDQVWRMELAYMNRLLNAHPLAEHIRAIGIDEVSVKRGHSYRIVVADLDRQRPIWMGDDGRSEADMDRFFQAVGPKRSQNISLAVMDMWRPFRNSTMRHAPAARIVFDKFHVLRHLSDALAQIRLQEYKGINERERTFLKGQRYTLLSHRANLDLNCCPSLHLILKANKHHQIACVLHAPFGRMWDYNSTAWAWKFLENWKAGL